MAGARSPTGMTDPALHGTIDVREVITEIAVSDLERSREWYARLFGKKQDLEPFKGNVEWRIGGAWVQISKGEVKPSSWGLRVEVRDLAREHERLRKVGIEVQEVQTLAGIITSFGIRDPDDNDLLFFQVLTSNPNVTGGRA